MMLACRSEKNGCDVAEARMLRLTFVKRMMGSLYAS